MKVYIASIVMNVLKGWTIIVFGSTTVLEKGITSKKIRYHFIRFVLKIVYRYTFTQVHYNAYMPCLARESGDRME